jgi:predicted MFS family arabinose efflux permease
MPLRLFADRPRTGAYAARFLFNGVLVSWFFFMTQYLRGVSGFTPLQAGLGFLSVTAAASAAAMASARLTRRAGGPGTIAVAACAVMLIATACLSRVSASTGYALGIALRMVVFGIGQGLGLSSLTLAAWPASHRATPASPAASSTSPTTSEARSRSACSSPSSTPPGHPATPLGPSSPTASPPPSPPPACS